MVFALSEEDWQLISVLLHSWKVVEHRLVYSKLLIIIMCISIWPTLAKIVNLHLHMIIFFQRIWENHRNGKSNPTAVICSWLLYRLATAAHILMYTFLFMKKRQFLLMHTGGITLLMKFFCQLRIMYFIEESLFWHRKYEKNLWKEEKQFMDVCVLILHTKSQKIKKEIFRFLVAINRSTSLNQSIYKSVG